MKQILLFSIGLYVAGCAHHPPPTDQVAKSIAAVRGAQEAGAGEVPEAALHLKLAQEQIEEARKLIDDEQNERAADKAMRAAQDAELALVLARQSAAQKKLDKFASANRGAGGEAPPAPPTDGVVP